MGERDIKDRHNNYTNNKLPIYVINREEDPPHLSRIGTLQMEFWMYNMKNKT